VLVVVAYDVRTEDKAGRRRLRLERNAALVLPLRSCFAAVTEEETP
jgi:hypothetical protein